MLLNELVSRVSGTIAVDCSDVAVTSVYTGDLLSDVMGHCGEGAVLVTVQNHLNTIAVCTLAGVGAIVICHGRPVPDDMSEAAQREGVAIVTTELSQFAASVALADLPPSAK